MADAKIQHLQNFFNHCAAVAQQLGITSVVIAARDPETQEAKVMQSKGALQDLKPILIEKMGVVEVDPTEVSWPS